MKKQKSNGAIQPSTPRWARWLRALAGIRQNRQRMLLVGTANTIAQQKAQVQKAVAGLIGIRESSEVHSVRANIADRLGSGAARIVPPSWGRFFPKAIRAASDVSKAGVKPWSMNTAATGPSGWPAGGRVKFQKYFGRELVLANRKARMGRNPGETISDQSLARGQVPRRKQPRTRFSASRNEICFLPQLKKHSMSTQTDETRWWLALNGSSVAPSAFPFPATLQVLPTPELLFGFKTEAEQQEAFQVILNAPTKLARKRIAAIKKDPNVLKITPGNPQPPGAATHWFSAP